MAQLDEGTQVPKADGGGASEKTSGTPPASDGAERLDAWQITPDTVRQMEDELREGAATYERLHDAWRTLRDAGNGGRKGHRYQVVLEKLIAARAQRAPKLVSSASADVLMRSKAGEAELHGREASQTLSSEGDHLSKRLAALRASHEARLLELDTLINEVSSRLASIEASTNRPQESVHKEPSLRASISHEGRVVLALASAAVAVAVAPALGAAAAITEAGASLLSPRRRARSAIQHQPLATIIILNYQGEQLLRRNLPSVLAAVERTGRPHEVLVVDNGSTDGSVEMLRDKFPAVRLLRLDRNYFFSAGNNAGVRLASHDLIVLLNNDMRVEPDFLNPLLTPFEGRDDIFAVSSQIFLSDIGRRREETGLTSGKFVDGVLQLTHLPVPSHGLELLPILWAGGGSCAIDRRKYLELGGLDVLFDPFYCEDTDLSLRAWQHGWKVLFAPESRVHHEHRATSKRLFGEAFVNETLRRNMFLLQWANLRDASMFAEHLWNLPNTVYHQVYRSGWSGVRSFAKALRRSPRAFVRRLRARELGPSDEEILDFATPVDSAARARPQKTLRADSSLRMVIVTPYQFHPPTHGGAVFTHNLVRGLAQRGHEMSVVGFVDSEAELAASQGLTEYCREVHLQIRPSTAGRSDPLGLTPRIVEEFDQPSLHRVLEEVVARLDPDVLHVEYTQMASYGNPSLRRVNSITEVDLSFVSAYRRAVSEPSIHQRVPRYLQYLRMFRYELTALRRFDLVFMVNQREGELLSAYCGGNVHVARAPFAGLDVSRFDDLVRAPQESKILFVGYFHHPPNVDAVLHFARKILPRIHSEFPTAKLVIAGAGAPPEVLQLAKDPRIEVRGFVKDLLPLYASAAAFVSPIRFGAGVRVKLLEAFAARVPVVASHLAAEGLAVADGKELLLADTPEAFAAKTLQLLREPKTGAEIAERARAFVDQYDSPRVIEGIEEEYRQALRRKHLLLEERSS
jgi:O-antigen biosynthesis protein